MDHSVPSISDADQYGRIQTGWHAVLNKPNVEESEIQDYLERNLCLLPFTEMPLNHGDGRALSNAVVTQPVLPGLKAKKPDFLYFTGSSGDIKAVFIEIESPEKRWFTASGQPTAELTQAASQISSWKTWFTDPLNVLAFERDYLVRDYPPLNDRVFLQEYILVIGRRSEFKDPSLKRNRNSLQRDNETWMTYDRLAYTPHFREAVTVRIDCSGNSPVFRVVHVPPTIKLGPHHYPDYHHLVGLEDAIQANTDISSERKSFLMSRLPYWRTWHTTLSGAVIIDGADFQGE
jgi:hypothetical protein